MNYPIFVLAIIYSTALGKQFSVSGISGGAFMAVQMHVAYSSEVVGSGVIAGGPYYCSAGNLSQGITACGFTPWILNLKRCIQFAKDQSALGTIDDISNLKGSKSWVFGGTKDRVVFQLVDKKTVEFFENFGVSVVSDFDVPAEHAWITDSYGGKCDAIEYPFINNCNLDAAGKILETIYGTGLTRGSMDETRLLKFNQTAIAENTQLSDTGYVYLPKACETQDCKVHICYHGCMMPSEVIGDRLAMHSGFNDWAEGSGFIIYYPQSKMTTSNTEGCFDWFSYTGKDYLLKSGKQMAFSYKLSQTPPSKLPLID